MVDDELLGSEQLGFDEWAVTPDPETLTPQSVRRERRGNEFKEQIHNGDSIVLTHIDADGMTSGALIRLVEGTDTVLETVSYYGSYTLENALQDILDAGVEDRKIYILDMNPDDVETSKYLSRLARYRGCEFEWFDHHQWDDNVREAHRIGSLDLHIDEDECTASLIAREVDYEWPAHIEELVEVTKDRDLWIRDDPRSDDLATLAEVQGIRQYIGTVLEHGVDFPTYVMDRIEERQQLNEELNQVAVDNAVTEYLQEPDLPDLDIKFTYISGGVSSEIGNELVEERGADIAIVMTPRGGASIYAHSNRETFAKCHEVAERLGGGGHPTAAGFGFDFDHFRDMADFWRHKGLIRRMEVLDVIADVVREEGS